MYTYSILHAEFYNKHVTEVCNGGNTCLYTRCLSLCLSVDLQVFCINFKVFDSTMFCSVCVLLGSHFPGKIYLFSPNLISTGTAVCDIFFKSD